MTFILDRNNTDLRLILENVNLYFPWNIWISAYFDEENIQIHYRNWKIAPWFMDHEAILINFDPTKMFFEQKQVFNKIKNESRYDLN